ncbi:MAG: redoxin family protein [Planctomycetota bacterium]
MFKIIFSVLAIGVGLAAFAPQQDPPIANFIKPGERVWPPAGADISNSIMKTLGASDAKATVIAFFSVKCPVATANAPKLEAVRESYEKKGARFFFINPNRGESPADVTDFCKKSGMQGKIVSDINQQFMRHLGVTRTTEMFVIDKDGILQYRGAFDDQFGAGTRKPEAQRNYLASALDAVLAGTQVELSLTSARGCLIGRASAPEKTAEPVTEPLTYYKDVAPIIHKNCVECHKPGEVAPMPLTNYEEAADVSLMIGEVVDDGRMPPWHADAEFGKWSNERRLTKAEKDTLIKWVRSGAPRGEEPKEKSVISNQPRPEWLIGKPDLILKVPAAKVPATGVLDYRYVTLDTGLKNDTWVSSAEVHAGNRTIVHHILVFVKYPKERKREQPPIDGGLDNGYFACLVPGERPNEWPADSGKFLPAGAQLLFQIHYTTSGIATEDVSEIGLRFYKEKPKREVKTRGVNQRKLKIEPNDANSTFTASWFVAKDIEILSFMPHMHYRGKSFRYNLEAQEGEKRTLLYVPNFSFGWQATYRAAEPIRVKKASVIRCTAVYDNSTQNPNNPDPNTTVRWGDQSWDEMMIGYIDYIESDR